MYCQKSDLTAWVLGKYLDRVEKLSPGVIDGMLDQVSQEINEFIGRRYKLPLNKIPAVLKRIAIVLTSYRCLGAITSLMNTEAMSDNDLIYIQSEAKRAYKELEDIAGGRLTLDMEDENAGGNQPIQAISPPRVFGPEVLKKY
ncbi:MAG: DUF1320 domain-containing protein [Desulfarculales bacterium]|jgi:phage gp36-like protein|nr:DUF1320 domain-containing protein [Desulfarculales bacterium]